MTVDPEAHGADPSGRLRWTLAGVLLAVALLMRWAWGLWSLPDLKVYLAGGSAVLHGAPVYDIAVQGGPHTVLRFTYPPFAALVFTVLAAAPALAPLIMTGASAAAYGVVGWACRRASGMSWWAIAGILAVGAATEPVQRTLLYGQVNLVLLALVLADLFLVPARWRGVLVGLAAGIKLVPAIFVLYFLVRRDQRAALRLAMGFAATVVVAWLVVPADSARYWFVELRAPNRFGTEARLWGNQGLPAVVSRAAELHDVPQLFTASCAAVLGLAACGLAVLAARRQVDSGDPLAGAAAIALGGLLASPVSWTHHWVWVTPVLVVVARRRWWWFFAGTTALFFLPPMWALSSRPDEQLGYSATELVLSASFCLWGLVVLTAFILRAPRSEETRAVQRGVQMNETASV